MSTLNKKLVEEIKRRALEYSTRTDQKVDTEKVANFFRLVYARKNMQAPRVELLASPMECQRRANELCGTRKQFYTDIAHNAISHAVNTYSYLKKNREKYDQGLQDIVEAFDCYYYAIALYDEESKQGVVLTSEFPTAIVLDESHKFHNLEGPALAFANGEEHHFVRGIGTTKEVVETPAEKYTAELFAGIDNADVRAEIVGKIGNETILKFMKARPLEEMDEYTLIECELEGQKRNFLSMVCPSTGKTHYLGAFPDCDLRTALAKSFGQKVWKRPLIEDGRVNHTDESIFEVDDTLYRHGDVQLKKTGYTLPDYPNTLPRSSNVLHLGTNNTHTMDGDWNFVGDDLVVLRSEGVLSHAEHEIKFGKMTVPPGVYKKFIHLEYNHFKQEAEAVRD